MKDAYEILSNRLLFIATRAAMGSAYPSWPDDFSRSQSREAWADTKEQVTSADIGLVDEAQLRSIGFTRWDEASDLMLIPLWAYNCLADGEAVTSISGDTKVKGQDEIDLDVRFGCIAWGISKPRGQQQ